MSLTNRSPNLLLGAARGVLDAVVADGKLITYGLLASHIGLHPHSTTLWQILGQIVDEDSKANKPLRSAVVVNAVSEKPGPAFIERAKAYLPANFLPDLKAEEAFWVSQLYRLGIDHTKVEVLRPA
jgi:hypothetical protein